MAKYTVILSYGVHSEDPSDPETFADFVDTKKSVLDHGDKAVHEAIAIARKNIRKQNGWDKRDHPDVDFKALYVLQGHAAILYSQMD